MSDLANPEHPPSIFRLLEEVRDELSTLNVAVSRLEDALTTQAATLATIATGVARVVQILTPPVKPPVVGIDVEPGKPEPR